MRLFLDIGHCDRSAKRGVLTGRTIAIVSDTAASDHGALLACAEGLVDRPDVEQAAKSAATALGDVYYLAVETDAPRDALEEAFVGANIEVRNAGERGRAAVVAAAVLHGRNVVVGNVGNVRVWRCRDQQLKQLTRDHLEPRALRRTEITRAFGLSDALEAEYREDTLKEGDVLLVTSAGVHEVLPGSTILGIVQSDRTAQQMADLLTQRAMDARSGSYVGACVARVEKLPAPTATDSSGTTLPVIDVPRAGENVDGFVIEKVILKSRRFQMLRAEDRESGETVALRFPNPGSTDNARSFLRAERLARRIDSPYILRPLALRAGRRTALYSAIEYRHSENLENRIRRKGGLPFAQVLQLGEQLLAALETLHANGVLDCDLRAQNMFYDKFTQRLWLLGLTLEREDTASDNTGKSRSGTLSYRAPELFTDVTASEHSDIYAAGVTIYHMATGDYPYGKIRTSAGWQAPRRYRPLQQHHELLPRELDAVLERACALQPNQRYASVAQFAAALSAIQSQSSNGHSEHAAANPNGGSTRWSWWFAGALAAGLATYLTFVLL